MNTDDKLLQILENSACLSKGQLTGYLKHTLYPEELRAVELHLSSCALCNDALEGLEMQQDVDKLIASMTPPVLPALPPKEKPKEKKETPIAAKVEKPEPVVRQAAAPKADADKTKDTTAVVFRPKQRWGRPIGIAAALLIGCAALWFWQTNRDQSRNDLAVNEPVSPDTVSMARAAEQPGSPSAMTTVDSTAIKAQKKLSDSLFLVKRTEQREKARRDSLLAMREKNDTASTGRLLARQSPVTAASKVAEMSAEADEAEKKPAAAPEKSKEKPKKEETDFELGLKKYKEKNYASALLYFRSAESDKGDPKHWDAVYYSGLCNRYLNKDRRARKMFERIVDADAPQKKSAQKQLDDMKKADD